MAEAKTEKVEKVEKNTVTRIVKGPKPIHAYDKDGKKRCYAVGEEVELPPHAAMRFARYLTTPELAKAEEEVKKAEAAALKASKAAAAETHGEPVVSEPLDPPPATPTPVKPGGAPKAS